MSLATRVDELNNRFQTSVVGAKTTGEFGYAYVEELYLDGASIGWIHVPLEENQTEPNDQSKWHFKKRSDYKQTIDTELTAHNSKEELLKALVFAIFIHSNDALLTHKKKVMCIESPICRSVTDIKCCALDSPPEAPGAEMYWDCTVELEITTHGRSHKFQDRAFVDSEYSIMMLADGTVATPVNMYDVSHSIVAAVAEYMEACN